MLILRSLFEEFLDENQYNKLQHAEIFAPLFIQHHKRIRNSDRLTTSLFYGLTH